MGTGVTTSTITISSLAVADFTSYSVTADFSTFTVTVKSADMTLNQLSKTSPLENTYSRLNWLIMSLTKFLVDFLKYSNFYAGLLNFRLSLYQTKSSSAMNTNPTGGNIKVGDASTLTCKYDYPASGFTNVPVVAWVRTTDSYTYAGWACISLGFHFSIFVHFIALMRFNGLFRSAKF